MLVDREAIPTAKMSGDSKESITVIDGSVMEGVSSVDTGTFFREMRWGVVRNRQTPVKAHQFPSLSPIIASAWMSS